MYIMEVSGVLNELRITIAFLVLNLLLMRVKGKVSA